MPRALQMNERDSIAAKVAHRYLVAATADVRDYLREERQMLDATRLLKPRTLGVIEGDVVYYYRRSRAWEIRVRDKATAEKVVTKAQADLIPKSKLEASDPYLHQLELYVSYPGGFVQASGLVEKKRDTGKADAKRQILLRGQEVFGKAGIRLSGSEGAYVLRIVPARKEFRGKFRPSEVTAPTLEKLSELLETAISKVQALL